MKENNDYQGKVISCKEAKNVKREVKIKQKKLPVAEKLLVFQRAFKRW